MEPCPFAPHLPEVPLDARAPEHDARAAPVEGALGRDDADVLRARQPDAVLGDEVLHLVQPLPKLGDEVVDVVQQADRDVLRSKLHVIIFFLCVIRMGMSE